MERVNLLVRRIAAESPVGPAGIEPTTSTVESQHFATITPIRSAISA